MILILALAACVCVVGPALSADEALSLSTDADVSIIGAAAEDNSGYYVTIAGDVNGDGIDDIVIGAWGFDDDRGKVEIVFGRPDMPSGIDLATDADVTIYGVDVGDSCGYCLDSSGDVNGDGIDDLVIGAWTAEPAGYASGEAYVVYGSRDLPATIDLSTEADVLITSKSAENYLGHALCTGGDVNADGVDDIVIGAYGARRNGQARVGETYVIYGRADLPALIPASDADVTILGIDFEDASGHSISLGDVSGDGVDDIVIGAYGALDHTGQTYVVYGGPSLPATVDLADADVTITGETEYDYCGHCVSCAGDVNGDGVADIAIGAFGADPGGMSGAGVTYVVLGGDLPAAVDLGVDADARIEGPQSPDHCGLAVTCASDIDGDGLDDVAVGAPWASPDDLASAGAAAVFRGGPDPAGTLAFYADADVLAKGPAAYAWAGWWIAGGGDVNADGFDDLAVGTYSADPPGRNNAGITYVLLGRPRLTLRPGWNLIGHMRLRPSPLSDAVLSDGDLLKTWAQAVSAGWVQEPVYYYDPGEGYKTLQASGGDDGAFRPGRGYWILNLSGADLVFSTR